MTQTTRAGAAADGDDVVASQVPLFVQNHRWVVAAIDARDAEIARLRCANREAFRAGWHAGWGPASGADIERGQRSEQHAWYAYRAALAPPPASDGGEA